MSAVLEIPRETIPKPRNYYTEPNFLTVEGLPTAYRRKGTGEAVVFLHGAGMTRMWLPVYDMLAQRFDVIAPEHPGFGETPLPPWLRGMDDVVIHYHEMFRLLGLSRVHLVGFSLGGWIAAEFAAFYPDLIKSLTLITPIGVRAGVSGPDLFELGPERIWTHLFNQHDKIAEFASEPNLDEISFGYGEAIAIARLAWTPRYNIQLPRRLNRVKAPALIVRAEDDRLIPDAIARQYEKLLPDARSVVIPRTGHALMAEEPAATAAAIGDFIGSVRP
jgi:pimeloyl-ACP methyl ester carboxylesterase